MTLRCRGAVGLALVAGLLAGAACHWYNLERQLDPVNAEFLSKVRYIITSAERHAFLELPAAEKPKFIEDFWKRRDPDPSSSENLFKTEYFKRIDQATKLFQGEGIPGWLTDRGRILILFGPPMERLTQPYRDAASNRCQEVWYYGDFPVIFIDASCTGTYRLATYDLAPLREYSLEYMHDFNRAQDDAQKVFAEEANVKPANFEADLKVQERAPDRIQAVLGISWPYERIWFKAEGATMAATLEAAVEIRDAEKAAIWDSKATREIRLSEAEVNRMTGKTYRLEIPILVEGKDKVDRLGPGKDALVITLTFSTGHEVFKKTMDFK
jgi:GWxTD domain-containing protein